MSEELKQFVIAEHTKGIAVHWDFMLESGDCLQTYRLDTPPEKIAGQTAVCAERIFDHPLKFLTYNGPVNDGKGKVRIVDEGVYEITSEDRNKIALDLTGGTLKGKFTLEHIEDDKWRFIKNS